MKFNFYISTDDIHIFPSTDRFVDDGDDGGFRICEYISYL